MNVNGKGVSGLIKVMNDLQEKGYYLFPAFDDHSPVDLISMSNSGKTYRLQVKYRSKDRRKISEKYVIHSSSVVNGERIPIDKTLIDGWAVYLADCDKVVYLSIDMVSSKTTFTIDPNKKYGELDEWLKSAPC